MYFVSQMLYHIVKEKFLETVSLTLSAMMKTIHNVTRILEFFSIYILSSTLFFQSSMSTTVFVYFQLFDIFVYMFNMFVG